MDSPMIHVPDNTHQFHVQYDFRFRLKGLCSSVRDKKSDLLIAVMFELL